MWITECFYLFPYYPHESPCRLSGIAISLREAGQCQIFSHYVLYVCLVWEPCMSCMSAHKETVVSWREGPSLLWDCLVFSLPLSIVKKTALSHVTSHFQSGLGSEAAKEHPAWWATMPAFSSRALWLSEWQAEKSRSAGMCVYVYDYTWWEEDVLFKRAVRLGSGKFLRCGFGSRTCFHIHNSTGCKGGVIASGLSVVQAHIRPNTQRLSQVCFMQ